MAEGNCKNEAALASKLSDLESMMKSLHLSLMDEKLRVNRECGGGGGQGDLPGDWATVNRLHLPQCPVVKSRTAGTCPLHGDQRRPPPQQRPRLPSVISSQRFEQSDRMDKLRQLYDESAFAPDFRSQAREAAAAAAAAEPRREHVLKLPRREEAAPKARPEEESTTSLCSTDAADDAPDDSVEASSQENGSDLFNPFEAIQSVHKRFLEFEHFVQTATAAANSASSLSQTT